MSIQKFTSTIEEAIHELETLKKLFEYFNTMDDEEAEEHNEDFYAFLEEAAELGADAYNFDYEELRSYYKIKLWLEMAKTL